MEDFQDAPDEPGASIAAPLIRALLAAAIAFAVYWLVFGQADPADDVVVVTTTEPQAVATVPVEPTATIPPIASTPIPTTAPTAPAGSTVGAGTSVQVLNGTDDAALFNSAVETLTALGYDVTPAGRARQDYSQTTVFATAGQEAAASALQAADPRFVVIGDNPGNLTAEIDVHVVVGADWTADTG